eukprot:COSAG05_NODE_626_length_8254_cov_12.820846_10_plen_219_part_00
MSSTDGTIVIEISRSEHRPSDSNVSGDWIRIWRALHEYAIFVHDPEKQYRSLSTAYQPHFGRYEVCKLVTKLTYRCHCTRMADAPENEAEPGDERKPSWHLHVPFVFFLLLRLRRLQGLLPREPSLPAPVPRAVHLYGPDDDGEHVEAAPELEMLLLLADFVLGNEPAPQLRSWPDGNQTPDKTSVQCRVRTSQPVRSMVVPAYKSIEIHDSAYGVQT